MRISITFKNSNSSFNIYPITMYLILFCFLISLFHEASSQGGFSSFVGFFFLFFGCLLASCHSFFWWEPHRFIEMWKIQGNTSHGLFPWKSNLFRKTNPNHTHTHTNKHTKQNTSQIEKICDKFQIIGIGNIHSWILKGRTHCKLIEPDYALWWMDGI